VPNVPPRRLILSAAVVAAAVACADAQAAPSPEQQLASRYSPVVALKKQRELCGKGEAYRPVLVDVVLGRKDVSLFNGAKGYRRLRRAPTAADLSAGPFEHYVDLPGHPVTGRCSYQHWFKRIGASAPNAVYAHVAKEPGHTGRLALQYWLYYVFNDYNDKHESDWEQIQLHFDADTVEEALQRPPVEVLYSQHEGAERAGWTDDKLEKVGGTHVVTYPGAGSHANYYRNALWLGRSADQGLGCDDSTGPSTRVTPRAVVLPTRGEATTGPLAWTTFEGHWGQRERGFNDGPLGPNAKLQWEQPFTWAENVERDRSFTVPGSARGGLDASDVFCSGVTAASELIDAIYASRWVAVAVIGLLVALLVLSVALTRWRPATLRPLEQRRAAGQILRVSFRVYRLGWRTLFAVGALVLPLAFLSALLAHALLNLGPGRDLVDALGRETLLAVHLHLFVLAAIEVAALGLAVAATAVAVSSLRLGAERVGTMGAYQRSVHHARPLAGVLLRVAGIPLFLATTIIGLPLAVWYLGRTAVAVPACVIEDLDSRAAIRRSKQLVGRHFWRVSTLTTFIVAAALLVGPFVGALVLLRTEIPVLPANLIGVVVSAAVMPLVGITVTLLFLDLRARGREGAREPVAKPTPAG
jgi:hypothetical protein